jgi:hypothetical protein
MVSESDSVQYVERLQRLDNFLKNCRKSNKPAVSNTNDTWDVSNKAHLEIRGGGGDDKDATKDN